jgi:hypothetical protein
MIKCIICDRRIQRKINLNTSYSAVFDSRGKGGSFNLKGGGKGRAALKP